MERLNTGIDGLDEVLHGGLIKGQGYLVRGGPGTGKTTFAIQFLAAGARAGESVLFISLSERPETLHRLISSIGGDEIHVLDLTPSEDFFKKEESYDIFSPAEVEREPTAKKIVEAVEKLKPTRVAIDSATQLKYLSPDEFQFRKQILSLLRFLTSKNITVILTSEATEKMPDDDLAFMVDGVISLHAFKNANSERFIRKLSVDKYRNSDFIPGYHTYKITDKGLVVFPKVLLKPTRVEREFEVISFGVPEIDELLKGGIERGTVTLISGPTGVGKTTLAAQFAKEAAGRGEKTIIYTFEESPESIVKRCENVNIPATRMIENGFLEIVRISPGEVYADEFANMVRRAVENGVKVVIIDSIKGYCGSIVTDEDPLKSMRILTSYLNSMGVTTLIIADTESVIGEFKITEVGISYIADNVIFLRYVERFGEIIRVIGVLKKRLGDFERTVREFQITRYGIKVGEPIRGMQGVLTGNPRIVNES